MIGIRSNSSRRSSPMILSQIAFDRGARGGLFRILENAAIRNRSAGS
jgi:hypothetical protein